MVMLGLASVPRGCSWFGEGVQLGGDQRRFSLMGHCWNLRAFTGVARKLQPRIRSDTGEELACCRSSWKTSRNDLRA
ncbi:hypothetical protein NL676_027741 [Syzygium grande]|nr:hypothetical protein NL676_027741 [Syzygium grande]